MNLERCRQLAHPADNGSAESALRKARINRTLLALSVLFVAAILCNSQAVVADEVATIVNRSNYDVQLYLKWSHVKRESAKIVLKRGQSIRQTGPDRAQLFIRFNANPGGPPHEMRHRVITQQTYPDRPGFVSYFRDAGRGKIQLSSK